jgi:lambda family phage portal protein
MLGGVLRLLGLGSKKAGADRIPSPQSRYDNARTGPENKNHWAAADALSPNAAANPLDRKKLRERARYEVANNSFAFGAANSVAEDAIGTGPRLQLILPEADTAYLTGSTSEERIAEQEQAEREREQAVRSVEDSFQQWADETGLGDTLRLLFRSGVVDGEGFGLAVNNPLLRHPIKLNLQAFECDRVTDPFLLPVYDPLRVDGIYFDKYGNVSHYLVLKQHPGDVYRVVYEYDQYPASQVYHWYRADRPGQARGVSWLTPALGLFAQLRRFTQATLSSAETAASISGIIESDLPPGDDVPNLKTMQEVDIPRDTLLTMPPGWTIKQLEAANPNTLFGDFRREILVEIARTLDMPLNRITGNSSGYNYSSGRLDHMGYHRMLWMQRDRLRKVILDRLFRAWLDEAALAGLIPDGLPPVAEWCWDWQWDAFGDLDPVKEAQAAEQLLNLNLTDLAEQCAARGRRWDQVLRQRAREIALMNQLGLPTQPQPQPAQQPQTAGVTEGDNTNA